MFFSIPMKGSGDFTINKIEDLATSLPKVFKLPPHTRRRHLLSSSNVQLSSSIEVSEIEDEDEDALTSAPEAKRRVTVSQTLKIQGLTREEALTKVSQFEKAIAKLTNVSATDVIITIIEYEDGKGRMRLLSGSAGKTLVVVYQIRTDETKSKAILSVIDGGGFLNSLVVEIAQIYGKDTKDLALTSEKAITERYEKDESAKTKLVTVPSISGGILVIVLIAALVVTGLSCCAFMCNFAANKKTERAQGRVHKSPNKIADIELVDIGNETFEFTKENPLHASKTTLQQKRSMNDMSKHLGEPGSTWTKENPLHTSKTTLHQKRSMNDMSKHLGYYDNPLNSKNVKTGKWKG